MIAEKQYADQKFAGWYNVGPDDCDCVSTGDLATLFCQKWGQDATWENRWLGGPHEANFLKLDCSKIKSVFGWSPRWHIDEAVEKTCEWSKAWLNGQDISNLMDIQINDYLESF